LRTTTGADGLRLGAAEDDTITLLRSGAGTIVGIAGKSASGSAVGVGFGEAAPAAWLMVRLAQPATVVAKALAVIRIFIPAPGVRR
jgi:hypothetical protein